jgi:hypothetical protein
VTPLLGLLAPMTQERHEEEDREHCYSLPADRAAMRVPREDAFGLLLSH